jgi:RNA recognition motif-containing protein
MLPAKVQSSLFISLFLFVNTVSPSTDSGAYGGSFFTGTTKASRLSSMVFKRAQDTAFLPLPGVSAIRNILSPMQTGAHRSLFPSFPPLGPGMDRLKKASKAQHLLVGKRRLPFASMSARSDSGGVDSEYLRQADEEGRRLMVSQLSQLTDQDRLFAAFEPFNDLVDARVVKPGQGYVVFDKVDSASRALENMHGVLIDGSEISVRRTRAYYRRAQDDQAAKQLQISIKMREKARKSIQDSSRTPKAWDQEEGNTDSQSEAQQGSTQQKPQVEDVNRAPRSTSVRNQGSNTGQINQASTSDTNQDLKSAVQRSKSRENQRPAQTGMPGDDASKQKSQQQVKTQNPAASFSPFGVAEGTRGTASSPFGVPGGARGMQQESSKYGQDTSSPSGASGGKRAVRQEAYKFEDNDDENEDEDDDLMWDEYNFEFLEQKKYNEWDDDDDGYVADSQGRLQKRFEQKKKSLQQSKQEVSFDVLECVLYAYIICMYVCMYMRQCKAQDMKELMDVCLDTCMHTYGVHAYICTCAHAKNCMLWLSRPHMHTYINMMHTYINIHAYMHAYITLCHSYNRPTWKTAKRAE